MPHVRAYLGMGANVGDAPRTLAWAIDAIGTLPGVRVRAVSRLYATRPVGVEDQPGFHNAVVAIDVGMGTDPASAALALLEGLKELEHQAGRRGGRRWGPRELDLDLLVFGRHDIRVPRSDAARSGDPSRVGVQWLEVPHVAAAQRAFVLAPLADLAPGLVPPGSGVSVRTALHRRLALEGPDAVRVVAGWDEARGGWVPERVGRTDRHTRTRPTDAEPRDSRGGPRSSISSRHRASSR
jgi:2-amino-4-hydroxy-6-hydroxymethyldihydropteridine diphosphokinase